MGLATENVKLTTTSLIGEVFLALAGISVAVGGSLISSDSNKGWMFGLGWGLVGFGAVVNFVLIVLGRLRK